MNFRTRFRRTRFADWWLDNGDLVLLAFVLLGAFALLAGLVVLDPFRPVAL